MMTPADWIELWDRARELPAFARHSPQALPPRVRRAWHVDEREPTFRGAPSRVLLELACGSVAEWEYAALERTPAEREALMEGELCLYWQQSLVWRARFAANSLRDGTVRILDPDPAQGPGVPESVGVKLRLLLEDLRASETSRREGQQEWRRMRQDAARPYLPRKD